MQISALATAQTPASSNLDRWRTPTWIVGDPDAGTRSSGTRDWMVVPGEHHSQFEPFANIEDAARAAERLSAGAQSAVGVFTKGDQFKIHDVFLGRDSTKWSPRRAELAPFALEDANVDLLSTGGYLGNFPEPKTSLVALVDGPKSAHLASTGQFQRWGFVPGLPNGAADPGR